MKNSLKTIIVIMGVLFLIFLIWGGSRLYWYMEYDMERLPGGKLLESSTSPTGLYTVKAYLSSGGATTNWTIKGVVQKNTTHKKRVIYWDEAQTANIIWKNSRTVIINKKEIDVIKDAYDYRHN
jgi:hypothetical protein